MATVVDQQPSFKHYCRICKKGFGCGRALGGHMRAHGIGEENGNMEEDEDEDVGSDWEEKVGGNQPPGNKRMYALRTNTNRLKNCRTCENCGKEFSSWKSFLEHGKCNSADAESLVPSKGSDEEDMAVEDGMTPRGGYGWSKGKRTRRAIINNKLGNSSISNCPSSEEEDLANCLVMLSNAAHARVVVVAETEESCASASKEEEERRKPVSGVTCAAPVTTNTNRVYNIIDHSNKAAAGKGVANTNNTKGMFECKACKKVFNSHQALGGHRASHKKVKGCFAWKIDDNLEESVIMEEDVITNEEFLIPTKSTAQPVLQLDHNHRHHHQPSSSYKKKSKVHECSICHRIFSSGQALGVPTTKFNLSAAEPTLDLNLPAPVDDNSNTAGGRVRHEISRARLSFEMPTEIYLQPWIGSTSTVQTKENIDHHQDNNNNSSSLVNDYNQDNIDHHDAAGDQANNNKVKLAKLSDLKDMNMGDGGTGGGSFTWLQVGIGSSTSNNVGSTKNP
ncbi:zinc finger protein [Macleaya cordata]|uniref:Zinc finger protein n=1 Tax=Macleaya cordata TaxID=56857 RepID=A0A200Q5H0_MACCD|nr:zinc finger protein [Macleaya cordata]